jgi:hypothetical protein
MTYNYDRARAEPLSPRLSAYDRARAEILPIRKQLSKPGITDYERDALNKREGKAIARAGLWGITPDQYARWLKGDDSFVAKSFVNGSFASGLKPSPASVPPSRPSYVTPNPRVPPAPIRNTSMTKTLAQAAPQPSRALQVAEIHLASINASRKRCGGLAPLTAAQLADEFANLDQVPASNRKASLARANLRASPSNATAQTAADSIWNAIIDKQNAALAASRAPGARASAVDLGKPAQAVDWSAIVSRLNAEAGRKTPARVHLT